MVATVVGVLFSGSLDVRHLILLRQVSLLKWYTFAPRNVKLGARPLDGRHLILLEVFAEMVHFCVQGARNSVTEMFQRSDSHNGHCDGPMSTCLFIVSVLCTCVEEQSKDE